MFDPDRLVSWLLACIADDERWAQAASAGPWEWAGDVLFGVDVDGSYVLGADTGISDADAAHIARWDPARVLAECAAKRALIKSLALDDAEDETAAWRLRVFAQVFGNRPGFDTSWGVSDRELS